MTSIAVLGSGCSSDSQSESLEPVENLPDWLTAGDECESSSADGYLNLTGKKDDVADSIAVVEFERLSEESQLMVRFEVQHEIAKTCTDASGFSTLLAEIDNLGRDPYREEHGERPEATAIKVGNGYYEIIRMVVYDQVLE